MARQILLEKLPAQTVNVKLNKDYCDVSVYQRGAYMYMDLAVNGEYLFTGICCLVGRVCNPFRRANFKDGILFWDDKTGECGIPNWEELGDRYLLYYYNPNGN